MSDLIDRQEAIDALQNNRFPGAPYVDAGISIAIGVICDLPSAQPERKTGTWIYKNDLKQHFCSECGYPSLTHDDTYIYGMDLPNFCEDCGADMRGKKER